EPASLPWVLASLSSLTLSTLASIPVIFCRLSALVSEDAREPPRLAAPPAPDRGPADGRRARRAARRVRAHGAPRRARPRAGGGAHPAGSRRHRRLPPRTRLPHEADRARCHRGRSALRRTGRGARARPRARGGAPETPGLASRGAAGARRESGEPLPRRHAGLGSRGGARAAPGP